MVARRLAVPAEPGGEVDAVQGRVGRVEPLEGECGAPDGGPLGEREMRVRRESGGEVQRYGQRVAAQPSEPRSAGPADVEHGHVEPVLERRERRAVDPVEEPPVRRCSSAGTHAGRCRR